MKVYVITGQTATGKTRRALELAAKFNGELVNADARQIYKKLDVITGKDLHLTSGEFNRVKVQNGYDIGSYSLNLTSKLWLYDIIDPKQPFSAHDYKICADTVIKDIIDRGKTPIIVGGTYFYIQNLLYGQVENRVPPDPELRDTLSKKPVEELQKILKLENRELFESLNNSEQHNPQRLIRRIEKERSRVLADLDRPDDMRDVQYTISGLYYDSTEKLAQTIAQRVEERIENGAIEEVTSLLAAGYKADHPGMKTIGYQQIFLYVQGKMALPDAKREWITKEVQYAKRQLTFMKKDPNIKWQKIR